MAETFSDLPDALVRDLLAAAAPLARAAQERFDNLRASRHVWRDAAHSAGIIKRKADLDVPREPSVVGMDGSYQLHRLTSMDLCAAAAIAVEGTAKEARRHWQEPYHRFWASSIPHNDSTQLLLRGLMVTMELDLANQAPHDLILLDGSFASLIIYLNQGLSNLSEVPSMGEELRRRWNDDALMRHLLAMLGSDRVVAVPKYTSRNELSRMPGLGVDGCDGRTLATLILEPGEYTVPLPIYSGDSSRPEEYHLPKQSLSEADDRAMNMALRDARATYFRPFGWVPALRLELPGPIANSLTRLSLALQGVASQFFSPAIVEPYPLFLADRMVKSLGAGVNVMEQTVSQQVMDSDQDTELTMLLLQNYRTEGGRGGV